MHHIDANLANLNDNTLPADAQRRHQRAIFERIGIHAGSDGFAGQLPFTSADLTAGTENELAAAVLGQRATVDLPRAIADLPFYQQGEKASAGLEAWLAEEGAQLWEHSWVRIARHALNEAGNAMLEADLAERHDRGDFELHGEELRAPASYVLKLALADVLGNPKFPERARRSGRRILGCFLNDNTAPEIISTHIVGSGETGLGRAVARENAQRFLLTQLLVAYANNKFLLGEHGQELQVYAAPNPPVRLRSLGRLLPADAYRELFMNPCLSGFGDGAAKRSYMHLCHETLSHTRMHAGARLAEAGIARPQVLGSFVCDTSLLNNGTHLSLGSRRLTEYVGAQPSGAGEEKYLGDLASKIVEHFLPLFVGLYSAAPARLAPADLRPERALGFLPHELQSEHLRLSWQSWKRKAGMLAGLKGDWVPDQRLLDYFAALPGSHGNAAHDGSLGNADRLKAELEAKGLFSRKMTFYTLYRLREQAKMGFSGFEGRHYSLFGSYHDDLAPAAELQALVTAYAYRAMAQGTILHAQIPDDPETESERRQIFFAAAMGLPVFYVRRDTRNHFLRQVLARTQRTRPSKRHTRYFKVFMDDYRAALHRLLHEETAGLADRGGASPLEDLRERIAAPAERGVSGRLMRAILRELGVENAMDVDAQTFNLAAEQYYRGPLRREYLAEGLLSAVHSLKSLARTFQAEGDHDALWSMAALTCGRDIGKFLDEAGRDLRAGRADVETLRALIGLLLLNVDHAGRREMNTGEDPMKRQNEIEIYPLSLKGEGNTDQYIESLAPARSGGEGTCSRTA